MILSEFNTPTERIRWIMVATRTGAFAWNPLAQPFSDTLAGYLDAPSARDEAESFSADRAAKRAAYCARKTEEGCRFFQRFIDATSTKCPTICATYGKVQPSATYVKTSTTHRMLRPREVARIHGFPEDFRLPKVKTVAYQVLGQGVCYRPFYALGEALGSHVANGEAPFALVDQEIRSVHRRVAVATDIGPSWTSANPCTGSSIEAG
jgi:DNA (cytosine-5)-methyltransferase 1